MLRIDLRERIAGARRRRERVERYRLLLGARRNPYARDRLAGAILRAWGRRKRNAIG